MLRRTRPDDAIRAFEIQLNWNVTRNLAKAGWPADRDEIAAWFETHAAEWSAGSGYRFAVLESGTMVGVTDVDEIGNGEGSLGYWFDEQAWGKGFAQEAAGALVEFSTDVLGLGRLVAGHAFDNPASGRVLRAVGFREVGTSELWSRPRGETITEHRYERVGG